MIRFSSTPALAGGLLLATSLAWAATPSPSRSQLAAARPAASSLTKSAVASKTALPSTSTPEAVVSAFLAAQNVGDDDTAYSLLTAASKQKVTPKEWADRAHGVRSTFSAITLVAGEALLIGGGAVTKNTVKPTSPNGNSATVSITQLLPINQKVFLVKENGRWLIDIQRTTGGPPTPANPSTTKPPTPPTPPAPPQTPVEPPKPDITPQCKNNLRQVGNAMRVYALDHNGSLPDADKWIDEITPYLSSPSALKCPPDSPADSNFAMNAALSGKKITEVDKPGDHVLLYETTTTGKNVNGNGSTLPDKPALTGGYLLLMLDGDIDSSPTRPNIN